MELLLVPAETWPTEWNSPDAGSMHSNIADNKEAHKVAHNDEKEEEERAPQTSDEHTLVKFSSVNNLSNRQEAIGKAILGGSRIGQTLGLSAWNSNSQYHTKLTN